MADARPIRMRGPVRWETCRTQSGIARQIVRLRPADDRVYRELVARVAREVERRLSPAVVANRSGLSAPIPAGTLAGTPAGTLAGAPGGPPMLAPWRPARGRWRRSIRRALADGASWRAVVATDVRDCYGSIRPELVGQALVATGAREGDRATVVAFLRALESAGVRGLPVGPDPSAVLANAALAMLDDAVTQAGCGFLRWVDDIVVFASDTTRARAALDELRWAADRAGLELHDGKTRTFTDLAHAREALVHGSPSRAGPSRMA